MLSISAAKVLGIATFLVIALGTFGLFIRSTVINKPLSQQYIDIQFHTTYFVTARHHVILFTAIILGLCSLLYFVYPTLFKRDMIKMLSNVHVTVSIVCAFIILYVLVIGNFRSTEPTYFLVGDISRMKYEKTFYPWIFTTYSFMILLFIQLMLIINIVLSFRFGKAIY